MSYLSGMRQGVFYPSSNMVREPGIRRELGGPEHTERGL